MEGKNMFSLIGHPEDINMLHNYMAMHRPGYKPKKIRDNLLLKLWNWTPSFKAFDISLRSIEESKDIDGFFVVSTFLPKMLFKSRDSIVSKIKDALQLSEKLGAKVVALGGFTSIADKCQGKMVSEVAGSMVVTNGSTLTAAMAIEQVKTVCELLNIDLCDAHLAVIGATGSIGRTCARYFIGKMRQLTLTGRSIKKLENYFSDCRENDRHPITLTTDNHIAVSDADVVICVTSTTSSLFIPQSFKTGAIVCDVGFPKNITKKCSNRPDIIVFSGGLAEIPGEIEHATEWGLPSKNIIYGCFAEAILIAMEGCFDCCTLGLDDISLENVEYVTEIAFKHGFQIPPFFNENGFCSEKDFDIVRRAREKVKDKHPCFCKPKALYGKSNG